MMQALGGLLLTLTLISCNGGEQATATSEQAPAERSDTIAVMTFNLWHGGDAGGQPLSKSVEVIRRAGADIVGAQETHGYGEPRPDNSIQMARQLGWRHVDQGHFDAAMTHYTLADTSDKRAVKVKIADDRYLWLVNVHLNYIPYQPYQLNGKAYGDYPFISTEEEAIRWASEARKAEVDELVKLVESLDDGWPIIVTGDFNEPSHLDWTERAARAGLHKIKVAWPSTKALTDLGLKDAYREYRPDEVAFPGLTWTPLRSEGEVHDRIDFILYRGEQLKLLRAAVIGEASDRADIVVEGYPSDHRGVMVWFVWVG